MHTGYGALCGNNANASGNVGASGNGNGEDASGNAPQMPSQVHLPSYLSRADSMISIDSIRTVQNNVQAPYTGPGGGNRPFARNRQNSNASMSSSVFSELPRPAMDNYAFNPSFDDELFSYYMSYAQQPNITPFDTRFPPSGILSLISKLFLENCILNNGQIAIDTRPEVNGDLIADGNRDVCLTVIRLRLISLCNSRLAQNDDMFFYNDQILPISRTNSIISTMSFNDKVMPNWNSNMTNTTNATNATNAMNNGWSHGMPQLMQLKSQQMFLSSTDSLIDQVNTDFSLQHLDETSTANTTTTTSQIATKRERPALNLHMPSALQQSRPSLKPFQRPTMSAESHSHPHSPGTPTTPSANGTSGRNPRGLRSSSLTNAGPTYFNVQPPGPAAAAVAANNNNNNGSSTRLYPPLASAHGHGHAHTHLSLGVPLQSPLELQSPFEQGFPSPLGMGAHAGLPDVTTPTMAVADDMAARKRHSLRLKRGPA